MPSLTNVNPTVLYIGLLALALASGVGEYGFKVVPGGTTSTIVGVLFGGGLMHIGVATGNVIATSPATSSSTSTPSTMR